VRHHVLVQPLHLSGRHPVLGHGASGERCECRLHLRERVHGGLLIGDELRRGRVRRLELRCDVRHKLVHGRRCMQRK
jgi:hypothetical protein